LGAFRIVGVYRDVQNAAQLGQPNLPELCLSFNQIPQRYAIIAVRTAGKPEAMVKAIADVIGSINSGLPMAGVATMDQMVHERLGSDRFEAVLYGTFAVLALVLAVAGIHGVMAFTIAQQRREIGLRIALGASPSVIRWAVLKQGVGLAAAGLVMGAGFAWYGGRLMQATLYGTRQLDAGTLAIMAGVLLAAAALGCGIPAMRAAAVEPIVALRNE
jgi:ABC-type antimicrobial peptide transport system permease subunit